MVLDSCCQDRCKYQLMDWSNQELTWVGLNYLKWVFRNQRNNRHTLQEYTWWTEFTLNLTPKYDLMNCHILVWIDSQGIDCSFWWKRNIDLLRSLSQVWFQCYVDWSLKFYLLKVKFYVFHWRRIPALLQCSLLCRRVLHIC